MIAVSWVLVAFLFTLSSASSECDLLSSTYFQWLDTNSSLAADGGVTIGKGVDDSCCGQNCEEAWQSLVQSPSCRFCASSSVLVCQGSGVYSMPHPATLPSNYLSLYKMSGVGFIALPPKSFAKLSIQKLVIENSNLTYIASDSFSEVREIKAIHINNNTLDYIPEAEYLFSGIKNLSILDLGNNGLKVLSSFKSANMHKLEYLSLAGNPIYILDVYFLQNSSLRYLDLRGIDFKVKLTDLKDNGFRSLPNTLDFLNLSQANISVRAIKKLMSLLSRKNITTLDLSFIPSSEEILVALQPVRKSLRYLSLEGTDMSGVFPAKPKELNILESMPLINLQELNFRNCNIPALGNGDVFKAFPNLNILSLAGNSFFVLDAHFLSYLPQLSYLDLSKNYFISISSDIYPVAKSLEVVDLSLVTFDVIEEYSKSLFSIFTNLQNLSLCGATIKSEKVIEMKNSTNLKFLDLSNTIPNSPDIKPVVYNNLFSSLNSSLVELNFKRNNLNIPSDIPMLFSSLSSLKILDLSNNLIRELSPSMFGSALKYLKLSQNLVTTWYSSEISGQSDLKHVDLTNNQITYVSDAMLQDFYKLNSLKLQSNPLICHKKLISVICGNMKNKTLNFTMDNYHCYDVLSNCYRLFSKPKDCDEYYEQVSTTQNSNEDDYTTRSPNSKNATITSGTTSWTTWQRLLIIVMVCLLLAAVFGKIVYTKSWNFRCYVHRYFSLRKARLLRKAGDSEGKSEVQYDVFVSYSDVDRAWVLDHLIPNMEADGDISLCFHERDFKVGMSILENIIDCMDRSKSLLLIVSSGFIRSKWCQFEMHLAQYRLIETLRDQLILVLLEDIPRKERPQTLHHLMMTKTYLVWPGQQSKPDAIQLFWKRLKRSLHTNHQTCYV